MGTVLLAALVFLGQGSFVVDTNNSGEGKELVLIENLRIGPNSDEEHGIWPGPYLSFEVNKNGHIFIVDDQENRILEFNDNGEYLRQFGGRGEGPGEFQGLNRFQFLNDETALAFESQGPVGSLTTYDQNLEFVGKRILSVEFNPTILVFSPDGKTRWCRYTRGIPEKRVMVKGVGLLNEKDELILDLFQDEVAMFNPQRAFEPDFWSEFIASQLKADYNGFRSYGTFDSKGNFYSAIGHSYKVIRWEPDLKKDLEIKVTYKPIFRSDEEMMEAVTPIKDQLDAQLPQNMFDVITDGVIKKAIKLSEYTITKPPVFGLTVMEDGAMIVVHDVNALTGNESGDIFDAKGQFIGRIKNSHRGLQAMVFKNGQAYTIELNEDDEQEFVRYTISWK